MTTTLLRQVVDTNDAHLRRFTHEYPKVFAKFTADHCALCTELAPCFARFADDPANQDILFVRLSAAENPVAQRHLLTRAAPLFCKLLPGSAPRVRCPDLRSRNLGPIGPPAGLSARATLAPT